MSKLTKIAFYGIAGTCILLSCLLLSECKRSADLTQEAESVTSFYEAEKNQFISRDSLRAQEIVDMRQNLVDEQTARVVLEKEFERFKSIKSHTRFESRFIIDTIQIVYSVPDTNILDMYDDYIPVDSVKKYFLQVPRHLKHTEDWFQFYGTVDVDHFMIDSLSVINKFDVTIGKKKSEKPLSFLRKKELTVELVSYNPYSKTNYINNIVVEENKKNILAPISFSAGAATTFLIFKLIQ